MNILKAMNPNGAFCRYFIRYFDLQGKLVRSAAILYDILSCRENFESSEAKWCILTLL